ncbi:RES domain-containing protein [Pedobacter lusitanus]|uniref:RES domain-containing protein n=1 Tax=Pedobacter lusitanus TaxID=1503925 RepID=UPI00126A4049|nr:RES domain-containing protein [Pedobacter lusitanus]
MVRISHNTNIFAGRGMPVSYFTTIDDLLAPPLHLVKVNRCNIENEQVLYCSLDEASAYWETKPKYGDIITVSRFVLKDGANSICSVIVPEPFSTENFSNPLRLVYSLIREFFVDVFTLKVDRSRPRDYIFSAMITSEQLFYPIQSVDNIEAIIYPSVQRSGFGDNIAIRNDIFLQKYNFVSAETRFILEEYPDHDPKSNEPTTDQVMASFYSYSYNPETGKISYNFKVDEIFGLFKTFQNPENPQTRIDNGPSIPKNIAFNMSDPEFVIPEYMDEFRHKSTVREDGTEANEDAESINTVIGVVGN